MEHIAESGSIKHELAIRKELPPMRILRRLGGCWDGCNEHGVQLSTATMKTMADLDEDKDED